MRQGSCFAGIMAVAWTVVIVLLAACAPRYPVGNEPAAFSFARARMIEKKTEVPAGPRAQGGPGDALLENDRIRVVIDHPAHPHGFAATGGSIIDAAPRGGVDQLSQLVTYLDDRFFRQAHYRNIAVTKAGGLGRRAEVTLEGTDSRNENLRIRTSYSLGPSEISLCISSTLINAGRDTVHDFALGDAVEWGGVRRFVPGRGFEEGAGHSESYWMAAVVGSTSYGWVAPRGTAPASHGWGWSDVDLGRITLAPGDTATVERYFIVGDGDVAAVSDEVFRLRGTALGRLQGTLREQGGPSAVSDARVRVSLRNRGPLLEMRADSGGGFTCLLPPGDYLLAARAPGRKASSPTPFSISAGELVGWTVDLPPASFAQFRVREIGVAGSERDSAGPELPARLVFFAHPPSPEPDFTTTGELVGVGRSVFAPRGEGRVPLVAGDYQVWVTHGPEYEAATAEIHLAERDTVRFEVSLARVTDTAGALAADFGVHTAESPDCGVMPADRVAELVAAGTEVAVVTDVLAATELEPVIEELGFAAELRAFRGTEVLSPRFGRFRAFPLAAEPQWGVLGERIRNASGAGEILDIMRSLAPDPALVVDHPPGPGGETAPEFTGDFDALEILSGPKLRTAERLLDVWAGLLNEGHRYTALGSSGSDPLVSPDAGYPTSYLLAGVDHPQGLGPDDLLLAVRNHHVVVTNGPLLQLAANGRGIGDSLSLSSGESLRVEVGVEAASWVQVTRLDLWENGRTVRSWSITAGTGGPTRFRAEIRLKPARDSWYIALARGTGFTIPSGTGEPAGEGRPFAFTNPIWVDAGGDGRWDPPAPGSRAR